MKARLDGWLKRGQKPLDDEIIFKIMTSLKITSIPLVTFGVMLTFLWLLLRINLIFFEANGFSGVSGLEEAYYEHLSQILLSAIPWFIVSLIFTIFVGLYISHLFLRPFRVIGSYCENISKGNIAEYDQELFTDLRLLTSFSEYFFHNMENALLNKRFDPINIMKKYQKIHKPVFEKTFFIQLFFILVLISVLGMLGSYAVMMDIYIDLVSLSVKTLQAGKGVSYFLNEQKNIFEAIITILMIVHGLMYILLSLHFHAMLSRPAFAIFATMRTFLKGNFESRIHMIGSRYVRPQSIKINKYLDYVQKNVEIIKNS